MTCSKSQVSNRETASWPLKLGPWLIGALILSAVILVVVSHGEIEGFAQLLRRATPVWLLFSRHCVAACGLSRNPTRNFPQFSHKHCQFPLPRALSLIEMALKERSICCKSAPCGFVADVKFGSISMA